MAKTKSTKRFAGVFSRTKERIANNLGIIDAGSMKAIRKFRDDRLELLDSYYENRQYDALIDWERANKMSADGDHIPVRDRKPRIIFNVGRALCDRVAAKLVGENVWPKFSIEDDPETTNFLRSVEKLSGMRANLLEPVRRSFASGSSFVRYYIIDGAPRIESYLGKYCYPTFQPNGELESVTIKWVYIDPDERDQMGNPMKRWHRMDLGMYSDILYDNPEYKEGAPEPEFVVVEQNDHELGWVQGEWLRTAERKHSHDGPSLYCDVLGMLDELNYSLSQSSQAVGYNQDPQLILNGIDEDELDNLIRSSAKAWNLGKEGKAELLEGGMSGVEAAEKFRIHVFQNITHLVRVVFLDPEKMVGSAQSAKAMEVLHGPLVDLVNEMRPQYEPRIKGLLLKMAMTMLRFERTGFDTVIDIPAEYEPKSLDVVTTWPPIFPLTIEDIQKKVTAAGSAKTQMFISSETALRYVAKDFGVEDIEEELKKIAEDAKTMAALNPFGSF